MPKITDYLWQMPHTVEAGEPPDVDALQQAFNMPVVALLQEPLKKLGYDLKNNDVVVRLDERIDNTADTYYANVHFIRYLQSDVLVRVHFQHLEWALVLPQHDQHTFAINLDRFKVTDPKTQMLVRDWPGRRHMRISNRPEYVLEHDGEDQIWSYASAEQLEEQLNLFWEKFMRLGQEWLEDHHGWD